MNLKRIPVLVAVVLAVGCSQQENVGTASSVAATSAPDEAGFIETAHNSYSEVFPSLASYFRNDSHMLATGYETCEKLGPSMNFERAKYYVGSQTVNQAITHYDATAFVAMAQTWLCDKG